MKKYINIIIIMGILFLGRNYIIDIFMDIIGLIAGPKPTVIYASDVTNENIKELKYEIKELNNLLELNHNFSNYEMINATVITRDIGSWYDFITIDKGLNDGLKEGMGVVTDKGLIGTIYNISNNSSKVRLLTNNGNASKISVRINHKDEYIYCILDRYDDGYILTGVSDITEITEGDIVSTSGLGSLPSGLIIGYVDMVDVDHYGLEKTIHVRPIEGIDSLRYVSVISKDM